MQRVKLKEIGKVVTGKTPSKREATYWDSDDIPFVKPDDLKKDVSIAKKYNTYVSKIGSKKANLIPKNSVLVTCIGTIGKVIINDREVTTNQQINSIVTNDKIDAKYLMYQILKKRKYLNHIAHAPVVPIINKTNFENIELLLPPLPQQKQIAQKLDKAKELIELRKESIKKLDELSKSVFIEMFGDPVENEMGWEVVQLKSSFIDVKNGLSRRGSATNGDIVLKLKDIRKNFIRFENINRILLEEKEKEKYLVNNNDILFIRVNGNPNYVGRCAVFQVIDEPVYYNDHIMRIKIKPKDFNSIFLSFFINLPYGKSQIDKYRKTSAGQYTISQDGLEKLAFYKPPIIKQQKFAKTIQKIEAQKALYEEQLVKLEYNFEALLGESFG